MMKFIPGSSFINNTSKFGKYFRRGQSYVLKNISPRDGKMKYIFTSVDGDKEIVFNSAEEADNFLSNF